MQKAAGMWTIGAAAAVLLGWGAVALLSHSEEMRGAGQGSEAAVSANGQDAATGAVSGTGGQVAGMEAAAGAGGRGAATAGQNTEGKTATGEPAGFHYSSDPNYYTETFRPQYHLSPESGNMSDPNGMVYVEGEYHQFYQNSGQWGHAVSTDLLHWEHLPVALARDSLGEIWSGSAVVDEKDTSGFFGGKAGLVAIFTHFKGGLQSQSIAYSSDKGRTWTKYEGNPVIPNPGLKDFRDPKVIWYAPTKSWVMVVSVDNRVRFYTSPDLKTWTMTSEFGSDQGSHAAVWECPDLFELPVEGSKEKRWVLTVSIGNNTATKGSTAQYFVGTFDGRTFKNDNAPSDVLWTDYGKDFYAAVSYSDIPAKDGRRIWLGWMSNWRYPFAMPTGAWKGSMSIPRELTLRDVSGQGLRLVQQPVKELAALRGQAAVVGRTPLAAGGGLNPFDGLKGTSYELETELTVQPDAQVALALRRSADGAQATVVSYDAAAGVLSVDRTHAGVSTFEKGFAEKVSAPLKLRDGKLKLRLYVDSASLEVFANDGETVISSIMFPDPTSSGLSVEAVQGGAVLERASLYPLQTVWRQEDVNSDTPQRIVLSRPSADVPVGGSQAVAADVLPYRAPQGLTWRSEDEAIAKVSASAEGGAVVTGMGSGSTAIRAQTSDGRVAASMNIFVYETK
ncbi:glycoside hydrolase family 32 protein [Paenibacillus oryzisoli]|uniref:GH32 C-terminal domain-containing protein n=1 Tax=Paenibacillus oryzisoli TaxID=1850517 RepID=UPI003D29A62D